MARSIFHPLRQTDNTTAEEQGLGMRHEVQGLGTRV